MMPDKLRNFIAPAGSNVAYIGLIIIGADVSSCLAYHTIYAKSRLKFNYIHELDRKLSNNDTKIYFDHMKEIIPLNWYTKFVLRPATEFDKRSGIEWLESQSNAWKATHGSEWMTRAALRWVYNIDKQNLGLSDLDENSHFDGTCLYKGYEMSQRQFAKFGVTYHKHQHDQWLDSQKYVVGKINQIQQCDSIDLVNSLDDDFFRGIALGALALKKSLSEESVWEQYIK